MLKKCEICGQEFETIPGGQTRKYCFVCVPHGLDAQQRTNCKRQAAKHQGVLRLGGHCLKCGETREHILNFHHINPKEKGETPAKLLGDSKINEFFQEISKCILLCSNCHGDFHYLNANLGITLEEYLGDNYNPKEYEQKIQDISNDNQQELTVLQQIQRQQELLKKQIKHIYQGKVVAYKDQWVQEFNSVKECSEYFAKVLPDVDIENITDGIRRVLNGKRKSYHKYVFVKGE